MYHRARKIVWSREHTDTVLGQLAECAERHRPDSPLYLDAPFVEWLARALAERRAREDSGEGTSENAKKLAAPGEGDHARTLAARVRAAACAAQVGVRRVREAPLVYRGYTAGRIASSLSAAAVEHCAPKLDLAVAAGSGRALWDVECESWVRVPADFPKGEYLALAVAGDSMTPLMSSGDVILVRTGSDIVHGTVVVARTPDDGYVVKRVGRVGRRAIVLESLNTEYRPMTVPRGAGTVVGTVVLCWSGHSG